MSNHTHSPTRLARSAGIRDVRPAPSWRVWHVVAACLAALFVPAFGSQPFASAEDLLASTHFDPAYEISLGQQLSGLTVPETIAGQIGDLPELDATSTETLLLRSGWELELFPFGRLWVPPLANQHEPRFAARFREENGAAQISTAIGAVFPVLGRFRPPDAPGQGIQLDFFAVVFTRLDHRASLASSDYRVGFPLTAAFGRWQWKFAFEHTSSHIGDKYFAEWFLDTSQEKPRKEVVKDEVVLGVARRFGDATRVYGQFANSFAKRLKFGNDKRIRFDWGVEWTPSSAPGRTSGPFVAFDMEFRGQQALSPANTLQVGWQRRLSHGTSSSIRIAAECYDGPSPWGQTLLKHESWWALIVAYDW